MRVVVTGATGNAGTSVVRALAEDPSVGDVLGVARRLPGPAGSWPAGVRWAAADIDPHGADLRALFEGADAVVHLAWKFQPTHDPAETWTTNVLGGIRVFEACAQAGVRVLVHASSVGAYSPGPASDRPVDESWPTHGWPGAAYTREKAYLERYLDGYQLTHPRMRVVRMRPAFLFKATSASEQRRIFAGPLLPWWLVRPGLIPVVPEVTGLRFQALHTDDAARAYLAAVLRPVRGPFNLVADPVLDTAAVAGLLRARTVQVPTRTARAVLAAGWRMHLVPAAPGLLDAVLRLPLLDAGRARAELGWEPARTATDAVAAFLDGLRHGAGLDTAPLAGAGAGRARHRD
ncbi:NAD-dependent epimerase/dehydratase family protein [Streptomyces sp. NBC_01408]|uniref:NAD-dependent epimerase/dehydratase family protein n=1 Tax=Streptomyces sp. NBC_01408 TaxID=2903855 RepID=UPI00224F3E14|nr:NAD-dependent epimerase/dehydratase family protein [Streptomyces sp. NBC_01408]MCX4695343.1 NAD-dependent epimerase/dehydratase family protein [Streptomyces sp. NBC_01408]